MHSGWIKLSRPPKTWSEWQVSLQCFLHCSTAYVNVDKEGDIEEKQFDVVCDPYKLMDVSSFLHCKNVAGSLRKVDVVHLDSCTVILDFSIKCISNRSFWSLHWRFSLLHAIKNYSVHDFGYDPQSLRTKSHIIVWIRSFQRLIGPSLCVLWPHESWSGVKFLGAWRDCNTNNPVRCRYLTNHQNSQRSKKDRITERDDRRRHKINAVKPIREW